MNQVVYKFTQSRWISPFITGASARIGTASDFRRSENHTLLKGDRDEGLALFKGAENVPFDDDKHTGGQIKKLTGVTIQGVAAGGNWRAHIAVSHGDAFILCFSLTDDRSVAAELDETYDACIAISNPLRLSLALTDAIRSSGYEVEQPRCGPVEYKNRIAVSGEAFDTSFFAKDPRFSNQREFRIVWQALKSVKPDNFRFYARDCGIGVHSTW